jgi:hypothetical protein
MTPPCSREMEVFGVVGHDDVRADVAATPLAIFETGSATGGSASLGRGRGMASSRSRREQQRGAGPGSEPRVSFIR